MLYEVITANIANAKTTHTQEGGPYKKQNVVFEEILLKESNKINSDTKNNIENPDEKVQTSLRGVGVKSVVEDDSEPVMRFV